MLKEVVKKILLRSRITHLKACYGALKTEEEQDRYPFIYSRDSSIIAMALDTLKKYSWVEKHYDFMRKVQFPSGEWVQRYNYQAQPAISRPKETDATALVVSGVCLHYLKTKNKRFIKRMWPSLYSGIKYLEQMIKSNGLVYGQHSIDENKEVEEGFEIWTNSWTCRAFQLASKVAKLLDKKRLSNKFELRYQQLLNNILEKMWNGKHFIKTIKTNGKIIDGRFVSIIAPAWAGIIPDDDKKIRKTVKYLELLWDKKIGGYQRFRKFEYIKDWHWYDGGSGSWLTPTIVMARLHTKLKQQEKAKDCLRFVKQAILTFNCTPEHISSIEEFLEWKENEDKINATPWLMIGTKNAEKNIKEWNWHGKKTRVVPWVRSLVWPAAELILNMPAFEKIWEKI